MKFDLNHIDDVFKDGLEDYSEQPSPGLWKKISSKMFWDDIVHLRFGNIPKMWLGTAAGIAILAVVLSLWVTSAGDKTETSEMHPEEVITAPEQQEQSGMDETPPNQPQQDVSIVSPDPEPTETGSSSSVLNKITSTDDLEDKLVPDEPEHYITVTPKTDRDQAETNRPGNITGEVSQDLQPANTESATEEFESDEQTTSARQTAEIPQAKQNVTDPETVDEAIGKDVPFAAGVVAASEADSKTSGGLVNQKSETMEPAKPGVSGAEDKFTDEGQPMFVDGNRSVLPPQKMPEIDVLSFASASPLTGGRRPVERTSGNMGEFMYGGYQPYFSVSAYFAPEVTEYHRLASESKENSYLGGVALSYNTENYMIQAGLEISRFNDLGDYMVNIHSYDSIGYYNGVSGFEVDPENPGELIFHTHTVEVWDTVQHHSHEQTRNAYTYLQVPVMVGYKALESGIFSAHIKAGPSFSFLLNRREPGLEFHTPGNATVAGIDNFTAPRIETNVQVLVSLALQMQFAERVGLLIEPTYRYYLNPVYDVNNKSLKNPYGIGVRGGLFFNF